MPPRVQSIDHVGIHVADVPTSEAFYRDVLGLAPIERPDLGFPGAWLRIGMEQELHLIGKNSQPDNPPRERHFAMLIEDAAVWAAHLTSNGVAIDGPRPRPDGALQIFLRDPDGHVIELLCKV
ncbi:MAG: lactoylglutathione lyase [Planctomycetota bacterium]|jgi:lactoylglutathione lyase